MKIVLLPAHFLLFIVLIASWYFVGTITCRNKINDIRAPLQIKMLGHLKNVWSIGHVLSVDIYGRGGRGKDDDGQMFEDFCDFRLAVINPYKWMWINFNCKVYRLADDGAEEIFNSTRCPQNEGYSKFIRLNRPDSGMRSMVNMKVVCMPFTRTSLLAYFTQTNVIHHEQISISPNNFLSSKSGVFNEISVINHLISLRIFTMQQAPSGGN